MTAGDVLPDPRHEISHALPASHDTTTGAPVEPDERLADYLADELDTPARRLLEHDLARDRTLRRRLESMRTADRALGQLRPPRPPEDLEERIVAAIGSELSARPAAVLAFPAGRRERRSRIPALVTAAAAIVLLAVIGTAVLTLGPGTPDGDLRTLDAPEHAPSLDADDGAVAESLAIPETATADAPRVVDADRVLAHDDLEELLELPLLHEISGLGLIGDEAHALAERWKQILADAEQAVIPRCLAPLLDAPDPPVPVYAELALTDRTPVVAYGLVSLDPVSGAYTRREVWLMDRDSCTVREFRQSG